MRAIVLPEARAELLDARDWYEAHAPGLGVEFARAVDSAIAAALRNPRAHPPVENDFRRVVLRRFPYSVIYHISGDDLIVVACFHHRRRPGAWVRRSAPQKE